MHLDFDQAAAFAIFAAPAFDIEAETPRIVTAHARRRQLREQFADRRKRAGVGDRIRARRSADRALVDHDRLVDLFDSAQRAIRARFLFRVVKARKSARRRMSSTKVDLPLPETPVTQVKQPSGNETSTFFKLFSAAPSSLIQPSSGLRSVLFAASESRIRERAGKIIGGQRIFRAQNVFELSLGHDFTTARSRARAKIDNVIGGANRFFIVLDHDDGIAEIAQPSQRAEQARVVALMQSDARLVQHIKNAGQTRSRSAWPAGCVALRRRKACRFRD